MTTIFDLGILGGDETWSMAQWHDYIRSVAQEADDAIRVAKATAYEQAAKLCEDYECGCPPLPEPCNCNEVLAQKLRALADAP